jgi:hypothetical protein
MSVPGHGRKRSRVGPVIWVIVAVVIVVGYLADSDLFEGGSVDETSSNVVFGPRESGRLIERLDAAARVQGVCYGWRIDSGTSFTIGPPVAPSYSGTFQPSPPPSAEASPSASPSASPAFSVPPFSPPAVPEPGVETGSNFGLGIDPRTTACARWVVFTADYAYNAVEQEWTSVDIAVESNLPRPPSTADLSAAGITTASLLEDDAAARLADAIGALPMIVAEHGGAPAVPEAAGATPPPGDQVASPGIGRYVWIGLAILMIIGGVLWIAIAAVRSRRQESPHA